MKATHYSNNVLGSQQNAFDNQTKTTDLEQCFHHHEVLQFWDQLSDQEREEILLLKDYKIIESVSKALNDSNFLTCVNEQLAPEEPINRTVLCKRKEKAGMIISIIEMDHICVNETEPKENNYFSSVVIILFRGFEERNSDFQLGSVYQEVEEEDLQDYIYDIELLEKHRALLKIKASKLETIMLDFVSIDQNFCQGNKKIVPETQYWRDFTSSNHRSAAEDNENVCNFNRGNLKNLRSKPRIYLASILKLFENNILKAYLNEIQVANDDNQFLDNQWTHQEEENNAWHQQVSNEQQYNNQQYHFQQQPQYMANSYSFPQKHFKQGYYDYYNNPYGQITPHNNFQSELGENSISTLIPVAHGVYFGRLDFILRDHAEEEQEFGGSEQPNFRGPRIESDHFKQSNQFSQGRYRTKRYYTYSNRTHGSHYNPNISNSNFASNYHQSEQSIGPLQLLLGKSNPYTQPSQLQKQNAEISGQSFQESKPPLTIPLLETIIKIPTGGNANAQINSNPMAFQLNQVSKVSQNRFIKPNEEYSHSKNFYENGGVIDQQDQFSTNSKQDKHEFSTTISVGSLSKLSDKDSRGESCTGYSKNISKNKLKTVHKAKFTGNDNYRKDWDRRSLSNQTSDTQIRKLSYTLQNLDNSAGYTSEFSTLNVPNDHSKNSSKNKI